jgi:hypothetical protein
LGRRGSQAHENITGRLFRAIGNRGHIPQGYGSAVEKTGYDVAHLFAVFEESSGFHEIFPVSGRKGAGRQAEICLLQGGDDLKSGHMVRLEFCRIQSNPDLPFLSSDQGKLRYVLVLLDLVAKFCADPPEFIAGVAVAVAPEGQRENRHIIDGALLDQRWQNTRRYPVEIGRELVVQVDDALLHALPDVKPDDRQVEPGLDDGVDILHPFDFPEQLFHGFGNPGFDLLGRCPRIGDEDVDHGHEDLRFFLARGDDDRKKSEEERCNDHKRRQFGFDERLGNVSRYSDTFHDLSPDGAYRKRPFAAPSSGCKDKSGLY